MAASKGLSPEPDDRRQNQTTVLELDDRPRTRRPLPEPDDDRSIELNQSFDISLLLN